MSNIEIVDYVKPAPSNPFRDVVAQLAAAGEGKLARVTIGADEKISTARVRLGAAARDAGYSASIKEQTPNDDGSVTIGFTLGAKRERKAKAEDVVAESAE